MSSHHKRNWPTLPSTIHAAAVDQCGHGDAGKPEGGYALADFAADVEEFMDALGVPATVLLTNYCPRRNTQEAEDLMVAISAARLIVYGDTGHLVLWEQPERVAGDVTTFIKGLSCPS